MTSRPKLRSALERLFSLQTFGIKLGLGPITALLDAFGNPHRNFTAVHVAGTNGKGSVSSMIASALQAAGLRVGLYTSPHLRHFSERIRVDGQAMDTDRLAVYAAEMLPVIEKLEGTFFEGTTAMGFRYFAEKEVDVAVVETGMGGRLDATNVLAPAVSVVTQIGFDHMKHLGNTLEEIAFEKAGIIKPDTSAVVGSIRKELRAVFAAKAAEESAPLLFVDDECAGTLVGIDEFGTHGTFTHRGRTFDAFIDLPGRYQIDNARVAITTLELLRERFGIDDETLRRGLRTVRTSTGIRGRFEVLRHNPRVVLDVAHNTDGARAMVDTLRTIRATAGTRMRFVFGAVQDKDVDGVMRTLAPLATRLYAVCADNARSLPAELIAECSGSAGIDTTTSGAVGEGIRTALADADERETIVVCGSFYVVADALEYLEPAPSVSGPEGNAPIAANNGADTTGNAPTTDDGDASSPEQPSRARGSRASIKDWHPNEQPRERLMRLGPRALSDTELLAILLRTGRAGEDVLQVSRNIIQRFENLGELLARDVSELQQIPGIGPAKAVTLAAAFEIGRRIESAPFIQRPYVKSARDAARIYIPLLRGVKKEQFHVLLLNAGAQVIRMELVSEGTLNGSLVHPREVFRTAIVERAAGLIGIHNHPSGSTRASSEDISVTQQLISAGRLLGIPFQDHIIIAGDKYSSMIESGLM